MDEFTKNVRRSGGVDENTATDIVGKTNDSAQSGGRLHGDQRLGGITQILRGNEVGCFRIYAKCTAARALRELGQLQESSQQWKEAVAKVGTRPEQIFGLADLARKWGWQSEAVDLWWLAAKDPINAEKTLRMLYDFYASRRDTQELYRVLVHLEKVRPTDLSVRNNLAQISLLLNLNPTRRIARHGRSMNRSQRIRTTRPLMLFHFISKVT